MKLVASFGFRYESLNSGLFELVTDCRKFKNPYHNKKLRQLNGLHPDVQKEVLSTPGVEELIQKIIAKDPESVAIGCTAGRHRSVAIAEEIGRRTGATIVHINKKDWPK